ncbi:MAG: hypothetical protein IKW98_10920 [Prevotella sp.]|nr:hypothetical protein [Prevotella sp.]
MENKILRYLLKILTLTIIFSLIYALLNLIIGRQTDWFIVPLQGLFFSVIYIPISEHFNKKNKKK